MSEALQVRIPQIGEGLRSARIVRILASVGEWVDEDDDVIEIETEKATIGIPSPCDGYVSSVLCAPGEVLDVGTIVLEVNQQRVTHHVAATGNSSAGQKRSGEVAGNVASLYPGDRRPGLPEKQISLIHYMRASQELVIPASLERRIIWNDIDNIKKACRSRDLGTERVPSGLEIVCWAVAHAMQRFHKFRWKVAHDNRVEAFEDSILSIAVAGEDDTLENHAVSVTRSDTFWTVHKKVRNSLSQALGKAEYHSVAISDMSAFQATRAQPVVVYPAIATLFIGTPYYGILAPAKYARFANLVLAFDHRAINGVYAAKFLKRVEANIRSLAVECEDLRKNFKEEEQGVEPPQKYGT